MQRHALVRDAPPAEGCTKGLYHLNLFVVRDDQSTAISLEVSLARSVPWEVHVLRQLGFAQQSDVDFEGGEAAVESLNLLNLIEASDILVEYPNICLSLNIRVFGTLLIYGLASSHLQMAFVEGEFLPFFGNLLLPL